LNDENTVEDIDEVEIVKNDVNKKQNNYVVINFEAKNNILGIDKTPSN
jgi:hypothetical protein